MRPSSALKLTVQQRLGFEITLAQARIERSYKRMQDDLHAYGKYPDCTGIELHEAEQILSALERVSGDYYRRIIEGKACDFYVPGPWVRALLWDRIADPLRHPAANEPLPLEAA